LYQLIGKVIDLAKNDERWKVIYGRNTREVKGHRQGPTTTTRFFGGGNVGKVRCKPLVRVVADEDELYSSYSLQAHHFHYRAGEVSLRDTLYTYAYISISCPRPLVRSSSS
jgi:hypothetical protein